MRREFTSVAPVVSGQRDDDVQNRTQAQLQREAQEKSRGFSEKCSECGGTTQYYEEKHNAKVNTKDNKQKSDVVEDTDNDDDDDNDDFVR